MRNGRTMFLHRGSAFAVPLRVDTPVPRPPGADRPSCAASDEDPVVAEALRQFKAGVRMQLDGKGEGARQAASALRVMAAHARAKGLDEQFRHVLQREVDTYGRDSVLSRQIGPARVAADAREFGLDVAPDPLDPDTAARRRVLEGLLTLGITPHLLAAAEFFDTAGADLDAGGTSLRLQLPGDEAQHRADVRAWASHTESAMSIACLSPSVVTCAFFAGIYFGARIRHDARRRSGTGHGTLAERRGFQEFG